MRRLAAGVAVGAVLLLPALALAQGNIGWLEGGKQESSFGDGTSANGVAFGGGFLINVAGSAGKKTGAIVPVGVDFKYNRGLDMVASVDLGIRAHAVSFGPGLTLNWQLRSDLADPRCLAGNLPANSSCSIFSGTGTSGKRDIGGLVGLAPSGFVKVNVGPQGRAFVQARYIYYPKGTMSLKSWSEMGSFLDFITGLTPTGQAIQQSTSQLEKPEVFHPVDYPEFSKGHDMRVSAGWLFGGDGSLLKVLRVQYSEKSFTFTPVLANSNGIFDQRTKTITVGFGVAAW